MTLTPEQVVASCQRAGIEDVFQIGSLLWIGEYEISATIDTCPGSALFIVAVLAALHMPGFTLESVYSGNGQLHYELTHGTSFVEGDTLTAACMAAIVSAYPEEVTA